MSDDKDLKFIDSMDLNGPIFNMLKEAIRQKDLEFEWIYGDDFYKDKHKHKLTKEVFLRLKEKLDTSSIYKTDEELNDLDIRTELTYRGKSVTSNIRTTIHGMQQIDLKQFMETNFDIIKRTKQYKIICGRGNHSENGPVLKKVIIEFCKSNKLKFKADSNGGRIIINP